MAHHETSGREGRDPRPAPTAVHAPSHVPAQAARPLRLTVSTDQSAPPRHHEKGEADQDAAEAIEERAEQAHELAPRHDATVIRASHIVVAEDRTAAHPFRPQIPTDRKSTRLNSSHTDIS